MIAAGLTNDAEKQNASAAKLQRRSENDAAC